MLALNPGSEELLAASSDEDLVTPNVKMTGPQQLAAEPPPALVGPCRLSCYRSMRLNFRAVWPASRAARAVTALYASQKGRPVSTRKMLHKT